MENEKSMESYEDVKVRIADFLEFLKKNYDGKKRCDCCTQSSTTFP